MIQRIKILLENILNEDLTSLKNLLYKDMDDEKFNELISLDPTYTGGNNAGNYGKWILNLYKNKKLKDEDFYKVTEYLTKFKDNLRFFKNKDIFQFHDLSSLAKALEDLNPEDLSTRQKQREFIKQGVKDAEMVYSDSDWEVYVPKTYQASCALGKGTEWCTATEKTDDYYKRYSNKGNLYIIISKHDPKEKYQFHFETGSFMDKNDEEVDFKEFVSKDNGLRGYFDKILSDKELQLRMVRQDGRAIKYIKNPSEEVQMEAVKYDGWTIRYIKNPSPKVLIMSELMK